MDHKWKEIIICQSKYQTTNSLRPVHHKLKAISNVSISSGKFDFDALKSSCFSMM